MIICLNSETRSVKGIAAALVLAILLPWTAWGQSPAEYAELAKKYSKDQALMLEMREDLFIDLVDGELKILANHKEDKLLLDENAQGYANDAIHYNETFNKILDIEALALFPKGNKYRKEKVTRIETKTPLSGSIFYDDNKYMEVTYPKMEPGSRAVLSYAEKVKDPHFLGKFYFSTYIPAIKSQYKVSFPEGVKVKYKVFHDEKGGIDFEQATAKGRTTYTWTMKDAEKWDLNEDAPSISYYVPHVAVFIEEYQSNGKPVRVLSEVEDLYSWYRTLIGNLNQEKSENIVQLADSLTQGATTDREKVRRIYYWVQDNIKYVAFEDGMSGFIPRPASKVCTKRYGDCKDMSSIITELLEAAEIPAYLTWIGSRDIPYTYEELPTPGVDNHMIAAVKLDNEFVFLDATSQHTPLGMPTGFIQGKEALVGKSPEEFELVTIPVVAKEDNYQIDSVRVMADEKALKGKATIRLGGYQKVDLRRAFFNRKQARHRDLVERRLEKGHNKFRLEDYTDPDWSDKEGEVSIDYSFTVPDYVQRVNDAIYVNLNLEKSYRNDIIDVDDREVGLEIDYAQLDRSIVEFEVPEGYRVDYLPESASYDDERFGFDIRYSQVGNVLRLEKNLYINTLMIEPDDFPAWNKMIKALSKAYNEAIVLKK